MIEQLVSINFEMLSISYIVTEIFLLILNIMMTENETLKTMIISDSTDYKDSSTENCQELEGNKTEDVVDELQKQLLLNVEKLTKTEHLIFDFYTKGLSTKEIMEQLNITENTLKFHNKNLYSKLNVSSRRQLIEIYCKR